MAICVSQICHRVNRDKQELAMEDSILERFETIIEVHPQLIVIDLEISLINGEKIKGITDAWVEGKTIVVMTDYGKHYINPQHVAEFNHS